MSRIRAARWAEHAAVTAVIADALLPSALVEWLVPEATQRGRVVADVAAIWVEHAFVHGEVYLADGTEGVAAVVVRLHRYRAIPPPEMDGGRVVDAADEHAAHVALVDALILSHRPTEPHHHVVCLAVRPSAQGVEWGRALLDHVCRRMDSVEAPSWTVVLPGGRDLFASAGYTAGRQFTVPGGQTLCPMRAASGAGGDARSAAETAGNRGRMSP
ncbi:N-acetyltransferase [Micromonospora sp. WMMD1082]|uniref:N-acetyltransferase n=1 Tax=Micromonospora sp. WMMD1082 TaxID=3016104 RepID=UPI0024179FCB|nr:N-acetyltransferase [Micromonospora sp. WMMD1082]MDG4795191.1 N-acetyltransferase [Micromonospora sp. WMMD1082]